MKKDEYTLNKTFYSKFLKFNIFHYLKIKFNKLIKTKKEQQEDYRQYQVDQANLIRNIKDKLLLILLSTSKIIRRKLMKNFYKSCMRYPNRVKKNKTTPRKKKLHRCFNIQYQPTEIIRNNKKITEKIYESKFTKLTTLQIFNYICQLLAFPVKIIFDFYQKQKYQIS